MISKSVLQGILKASMFKEALYSCQLEGIGLDITIEDLYLAELGIYKNRDKERKVKKVIEWKK